MEINRYAIVDGDGLVVNVILWDGDQNNWQPPEGTVANLLADDSPVSPGWTWIQGDEYSPPQPG